MEINNNMTPTSFEILTYDFEDLNNNSESSETSETSSSMSDLDFESEYPHLLELAFASRNRVQVNRIDSSTACRRGGVMITH